MVTRPARVPYTYCNNNYYYYHPPTLCPSQVSQLHGTYRRGGGGQLSRSSVFLLSVRSAGRVLTSLCDTCDPLLVLCHAHACLWNALLAGQAVYYGHGRRRRQREERKRREREGEREGWGALGASESGSDSDNTDSEVVVEHFRRRRTCNAFTVHGGGAHSV